MVESQTVNAIRYYIKESEDEGRIYKILLLKPEYYNEKSSWNWNGYQILVTLDAREYI